MDPLLTSASLNQNIVYESSWNTYRLKGDLEKFRLQGSRFDPERVLLDAELVQLQEELYQKVETLGRHQNFSKIFKKLNPYELCLDYRKEDRNGTYFSLISQNLRKALLPKGNGSKIITNDARTLHFCKEVEARAFYLSPYKLKNTNVLSSDDQFMIDYKSLHPTDNYSFPPITQKNDWEWDFYDDAEDIEADLLILRESNEGRDQDRMVERRGPFIKGDDQFYQKEHFEVSINALSQLKLGGNLVMQFISLGSQHVADLVYFYASVFDEIELYMPLASDFLSMEHYLVCRGFKKEFYARLMNEKLVELMDEWTNDSFYPYYPKISKFDEDLSFLEWIKDLNDKMMNYHLVLMMALLQAHDDTILHSYPEVRFPYDLDPYKLKLSMGILDLKKSNVDASQIFQEVETLDWKARENFLTSTGQISKNAALPPALEANELNYRFCLYLSLMSIVDYIHKANPKYNKNTSIVSSWFLDLLYEGKLEQILKEADPMLRRNYYEPWRFEHWFRLPEFTSKSIEIDFLDKMFGQLKSYVDNYYNNRQKLMEVMTVKMIKTKTVKYRVQFAFNAESYMLQSPGRSELVITQRQLLGIIPNSYKTSEAFFSLSLLDGWIKEKKFVVRVLNLLSMPMFSANYGNSVVFHKFFEVTNIDFDLLASPWIKHGIHWSSFWKEDQELGALGEERAFDANDSYYQEHPDLKSFWLFPPQKKEIFANYMEKAKSFLLGRHQLSRPTILYFAYQDKIRDLSDIADDLKSDLEDQGLKLRIEINKNFFKYEMIGDNYYNGEMVMVSIELLYE